MSKLLPSKEPVVAVSTLPRKRDRAATLHQLNLALNRLQKRGDKITIKAVADETLVSSALIINRYPDFAEQVRALMGKAVRQQKKDKSDLLVEERKKNRNLRELVSSQLAEITKLASVNAALRMEMVVLKGVAEGKVVKGDFGSNRS